MRFETMTIKRVGINGEGIGYVHNKICFVKNALPLEEVDVKIVKEERRFMIGEVKTIKKKSSMRQKSPCRQFPACGGCALLHMNYADQLNFKLDILKETLEKYAPYDLSEVHFYPVQGMESNRHYRQQIALPVTYDKGKLRVGIYQRESKILTYMDHCVMQDRVINDAIVKIEEILNKYHCHDYNDKFKKGIRFLIIRKVSDELQVIFVTGTDGIDKKATHEMTKIDAVKGLFYTVNTTRHQDFALQGYKRIYGTPYLSYDYNGHTYTFSVKTDLIENTDAFDAEVKLLRERIAKEDKVLSINCGNAIVECELDQEIVAIDESKENTDSAEKNIEKNGFEHIRVIHGKVKDIAASQMRHHKYDTVIIRLKRDQINGDLVESLYKGHVQKVILISDNVSSLAKSLKDENDYFVKYFNFVSADAIDHAPHSARANYILTLERK